MGLFNLGGSKMSALDERWLSVDEIAEYLGVSKDTVYGWINSRAMPAHRAGRLWKFKRDDIDNWVKSGGASDKTENSR